MDPVGNGKNTEVKENPIDGVDPVENASDGTESPTKLNVLPGNPKTTTNGKKTAKEPPSTEVCPIQDMTDSIETVEQASVPSSFPERETSVEKAADEKLGNDEESVGVVPEPDW